MKFNMDQIRSIFSERVKKPDRLNCTMGFVEAAVFIPLVETLEGLSLVFEVRSSELAWQPGEISFPGGKVEKTDLDTGYAALRETSEELGLPFDELSYFGNMDPFISPLGLVIYPVVGKIESMEKIIPQASEVAEVFAVPLEWFLSTEPQKAMMEMGTRPMEEVPFPLLPEKYNREWRRRSIYPVYFYPYQGHVIWGLTAQVVRQFLEVILQNK